MNEKIKREWISALESGKYKQTQDTLREYDRVSHRSKFCCLGVLCEVLGLQRLRYSETGFNYITPSGVELDTLLDLKTCNLVGLTVDDQETLIGLNDSEELSFKEIAKYIRENL